MYNNMAEWLKANPKENITIVGYADKNTGTAEYNMVSQSVVPTQWPTPSQASTASMQSRLTIRFDRF